MSLIPRLLPLLHFLSATEALGIYPRPDDTLQRSTDSPHDGVLSPKASNVAKLFSLNVPGLPSVLSSVKDVPAVSSTDPALSVTVITTSMGTSSVSTQSPSATSVSAPKGQPNPLGSIITSVLNAGLSASEDVTSAVGSLTPPATATTSEPSHASALASTQHETSASNQGLNPVGSLLSILGGETSDMQSPTVSTGFLSSPLPITVASGPPVNSFTTIDTTCASSSTAESSLTTQPSSTSFTTSALPSTPVCLFQSVADGVTSTLLIPCPGFSPTSLLPPTTPATTLAPSVVTVTAIPDSQSATVWIVTVTGSSTPTVGSESVGGSVTGTGSSPSRSSLPFTVPLTSGTGFTPGGGSTPTSGSTSVASFRSSSPGGGSTPGTASIWNTPSTTPGASGIFITVTFVPSEASTASSSTTTPFGVSTPTFVTPSGAGSVSGSVTTPVASFMPPTVTPFLSSSGAQTPSGSASNSNTGLTPGSVSGSGSASTASSGPSVWSSPSTESTPSFVSTPSTAPSNVSNPGLSSSATTWSPSFISAPGGGSTLVWPSPPSSSPTSLGAPPAVTATSGGLITLVTVTLPAGGSAQTPGTTSVGNLTDQSTPTSPGASSAPGASPTTGTASSSESTSTPSPAPATSPSLRPWSTSPGTGSPTKPLPGAGSVSIILVTLSSPVGSSVSSGTSTSASGDPGGLATPPPATLSSEISATPSPTPRTVSTVYIVSTVTYSVTATSIQTSLITTCLGATSLISSPGSPGQTCNCPVCPAPSPCQASSGTAPPISTSSGGSSAPGSPSPASVSPGPASGSPYPTAGGQGPCPGQGYICDDCLDGWFCPPTQTPPLPAPCGYGWPCYHCSHSWFCVPQPTTVTVCPLSQPTVASVGATSASPQHTTGSTASLTTFVTSSPSFHPATGGWSYAGCFRDDAARSLKNYSVLAPVAGGMTNDKCIGLCRDNNFSIAGTEDGFQCFCGDVLVDSMLLDDTRCNMTCDGGSSGSCGGAWALSLWSADGKVPQVAGPEHQFTLPQPSPGARDISVHPGGIMQSVVPVTTVVWAWPSLMTREMASTSSMGSSAMANILNRGVPAPSGGHGADIIAMVLSAISDARRVGEPEISKISQAVGAVQTLGSKSIGQEAVEAASQEYSGPTSFAGPPKTAKSTPLPSAHGGFTGKSHGLGTHTPLAGSVSSNQTTLLDAASETALSPTVPSLPSSDTEVAATPAPTIRYRGFYGRYRGVMPFNA